MAKKLRPKAYFEKIMRIYKESELAFKIQHLAQNELPILISANSMNGNVLSIKLSEVCRSKKVLEFGSGGSTLLLAEFAEQLISVESDKKFASQVNKRLENLNYNSKASVIYANIGPTKSFGQPISCLAPIFKNKYKNYAGIFDNLDSQFNPDVVFVDGRFRVWCSIQACQKLEQNFILIVDDYFDRTEYHEIENFLGQAKIFSENTAYFEVQPKSINNRIFDTLDYYSLDYR
jgi:hypothetical protein